METIVLKVEGMSCEHCVSAVNKVINSLDGIGEVVVSLEQKTATVTFDPGLVDVARMKAEIEDQGYDVLD